MSNELNTLINQRKKNSKKKKSQIIYAVILSLVVLFIYFILLKKNFNYSVCWILGIAIGIVLRHSHFCFAAAFREPILSKNTKILRGILLSMIVSTIGFSLIQNHYITKHPIDYNLIPGAISSVGPHVMFGAFIFGIGMILAGGCSSGVLIRIGEGHSLHWVVLLGFLIGTSLGAKDYSFWYKYLIKDWKIVYFPEYLDLKFVVLIQICILLGLYKFAAWYEKNY